MAERLSSVTSNRSCYISAGLDKRNCYSLVVPRGERSPKVFCWSTNPNFRSIISPLFFSFDDNLGIIKIIIYLRAMKTRSKYFFESWFNLKKKEERKFRKIVRARAYVCAFVSINATRKIGKNVPLVFPSKRLIAILIRNTCTKFYYSLRGDRVKGWNERVNVTLTAKVVG